MINENKSLYNRKKLLIDLQNRIDRADCIYYNGGDSGISDTLYDRWKDDLAILNPEDERLTRVGSPVSVDNTLNKIEHTAFMGSQNKATSIEEFEKWYESVGSPVVFVSPKVDGASLRAYYEQKEDSCNLKMAVTRGDGKIGEDITANVIRFINFPRNVNCEENFSIRGEAVLYKSEWDILDPDHLGNPRNIGSGIIQRSDGQKCEHMHFLAFDIDNETGFQSEYHKMLAASQMKFEFIEGQVCENISQIKEAFEKIEKNRENYPFWIDGIVVKINNIEEQNKHGISGNRPKGQISFKFKPETAKTVLRKVVLTVGHTGAIIPTGEFDPVRLGGTTVSNALLCNWEVINNLDIAVGDTVEIQKSGEIIPKVISVVLRPSNRQPILEPKICPECGEMAARRVNSNGMNGSVTECTNAECNSKISGKIKRWIKSLDIQGLGDEILDVLSYTPLSSLIITKEICPILINIQDLYSLERTIGAINLGKLMVGKHKLGEKRANSIFEEINKKRNLTIDQFLGSLGIKHLGKRKVEAIREKSNGELENIEKWLTDKKGQSYLIENSAILGIPNICTEIQQSINNNRDLIKSILTKEIRIIQTGEKVNINAFSFCLTGSMSKPRKEIEREIVKHGFNVKSEVNKDLTYLVQADPSESSSKSKKAQKFGVKIISEKELYQIIHN